MRKGIFLTLFFIVITFSTSTLHAQFGEPEVRGQTQAKNLYDEGYRSGFGFSFGLNDSGFGFGGQYRRVVSKYSEVLFNFRISGIKDPKEQSYIDYYFGFKTTPNKYKRILSFPVSAGFKRRLFPETISDNFRVYASISGGPVFAYSFPYFEDLNENGFQENNSNIYGFSEPAYDIFSGWKNPDSHFGWNGELQVGIDLGSDFGGLQAVQFGYSFSYFSKGLQIMQPKEPLLDAFGQIQFDNTGQVVLTDSYQPRKYFGTPQITFIFGWMWQKK